MCLCSHFEHYCQWAKASSLPKHAACTVPTCACLGKQHWGRECFTAGWNTLALNKHLLHIALGSMRFLSDSTREPAWVGDLIFSLSLKEMRCDWWHTLILRFHLQLPVRRRKEQFFKWLDLSIAFTWVWTVWKAFEVTKSCMSFLKGLLKIFFLWWMLYRNYIDT